MGFPSGTSGHWSAATIFSPSRGRFKERNSKPALLMLIETPSPETATRLPERIRKRRESLTGYRACARRSVPDLPPVMFSHCLHCSYEASRSTRGALKFASNKSLTCIEQELLARQMSAVFGEIQGATLEAEIPKLHLVREVAGSILRSRFWIRAVGQ